jgi:chloramphenicol-sensitive protein RarD
MKPDSQHQQGLVSIAAAFAFWGIVVVFWKHLSPYNSIELIIHRIIWSFLLLIVTIGFRGNLKLLWHAFSDWKLIRLHLLNSILLALNWFSYVYAVTHGQILQGSLAYFMVPILNTSMGLLILGERLNRLQWAAIALATFGVLNEIVQFGKIPWLALIMAVTFAFYGLNKTRSNLGPMTSLAMETGLLFPVAVAALVHFQLSSGATVDLSRVHDEFWMVSAGFITVVPLLLFAYGAKRIQLTTIGIFQFLAPSITFLLGVFVYGEPFPPSKMITFVLIWIALILYLIHLFKKQRTIRPPLPQ